VVIVVYAFPAEVPSHQGCGENAPLLEARLRAVCRKGIKRLLFVRNPGSYPEEAPVPSVRFIVQLSPGRLI
jgi:hypothetical protein